MPPIFCKLPCIWKKRKFVENLKFLGALLWKLLIFQFHSAMYILWNLEFMRKRPEAKAKSWWILQKICFITYILYYNLVKKTFLNQCMTPQWPPTYWSPCRTTRTRFRYHHKNEPKPNLWYLWRRSKDLKRRNEPSIRVVLPMISTANQWL